MKPIRSESRTRVAHEPWQQDCEHPTDQEETQHALTDDGAIASHSQVHRRACVCGCLKPGGGFCAVCRGLVCIDCFGLCQQCRMPLCGRHSVFLPQEHGNTRLCSCCAATLRRRQRCVRLLQALISPFVRPKERDSA